MTSEEIKVKLCDLIEKAKQEGRSLNEYLGTPQGKVAMGSSFVMLAACYGFTTSLFLNSRLSQPEASINVAIYTGVFTGTRALQIISEDNNYISGAWAVISDFPDFLRGVSVTIEDIKEFMRSLGASESEIDAIPDQSMILPDFNQTLQNAGQNVVDLNYGGDIDEEGRFKVATERLFEILFLIDDVNLELYYDYNIGQIMLRLFSIGEDNIQVIKNQIPVIDQNGNSRLVYDNKNFAILTPNDNIMTIKMLINGTVATNQVTLLLDSGLEFSWNAEMIDGELYWWYVQYSSWARVEHGTDDFSKCKCAFVICRNLEIIEQVDLSSDLKSNADDFNNSAIRMIHNAPYSDMLTQYANEWSTEDASNNTVYSYEKKIISPPNSPPNTFKITDTKAYIDNVGDFIDLKGTHSSEFLGIESRTYTYYYLAGFDLDNKRVIVNASTYLDGNSSFKTAGIDMIINGITPITYGCYSWPNSATYRRNAYCMIGDVMREITAEDMWCKSLFASGSDLSTKYSLDGDIRPTDIKDDAGNVVAIGYICSAFLKQSFKGSVGKFLYTISDPSQYKYVDPPRGLMTNVKLSNKYSVLAPCLTDEAAATFILLDMEADKQYDLTEFINELGTPSVLNYQFMPITDLSDDTLFIRGTYIYKKSESSLNRIDNSNVFKLNLQYNIIPFVKANEFVSYINE
jgi:hypothetical protein